jgi:hypothetical protein
VYLKSLLQLGAETCKQSITSQGTGTLTCAKCNKTSQKLQKHIVTQVVNERACVRERDLLSAQIICFLRYQPEKQSTIESSNSRNGTTSDRSYGTLLQQPHTHRSRVKREEFRRRTKARRNQGEPVTYALPTGRIKHKTIDDTTSDVHLARVRA